MGPQELPIEARGVPPGVHTALLHGVQCCPNVADANIIGAFLSGTTCKSLVHKLGRKGPRTTKELLDIATNHASGEEVVGESLTEPRVTRPSGTT